MRFLTFFLNLRCVLFLHSKTMFVLFQVEPNTKLFPAVFIQPSNQNMVQLELGKLKVRS